MPNFNWEHFITIAHKLLVSLPAGCDADACYRTIINRAYYGIFKLAYEKAVSVYGMPKTKDRVHSKVISIYSGLTGKDERYVYSVLKSLRISRVNADYEDVWRLRSLDRESRSCADRSKMACDRL